MLVTPGLTLKGQMSSVMVSARAEWMRVAADEKKDGENDEERGENEKVDTRHSREVSREGGEWEGMYTCRTRGIEWRTKSRVARALYHEANVLSTSPNAYVAMM